MSNWNLPSPTTVSKVGTPQAKFRAQNQQQAQGAYQPPPTEHVPTQPQAEAVPQQQPQAQTAEDAAQQQAQQQLQEISEQLEVLRAHMLVLNRRQRELRATIPLATGMQEQPEVPEGQQQQQPEEPAGQQQQDQSQPQEEQWWL